MTQEDKELLLKDLCSRLPYRTIIQVTDWTLLDTELKVGHISQLMNEDLKLKPYLRPMSSMTEEEKEELRTIKWTKLEHYTVDWLNAHYFDYHSLIERGLAISVTEENNPYERAN